jgi:hypothetical protein
MKDMIWLGGVAAALWLGVLSIIARRWWPLAYVFALFFGFGAGMLLWSWPEPAVSFWWMLWLVYAVVLPIGKIIVRRHRALYGE